MYKVPNDWKLGNFMEMSLDEKLLWLYNHSGEGGSDLPDVSASDNGDVLTVVNGEWDKAEPSKELPSVTSSDNGDVLTVVEGAWAKATPSAELPAVTSSDNGDVLTVVEGEWAKATPSASSDAFEVHFTLTYDQQTSSYVATSDKTYSEIYAAHTANKKIYAWVSRGSSATLLTSGYIFVSTTFIFYFSDKTDPGYYERCEIRVSSETITAFVSFECEPVYIQGDYYNGATLDEASLAVYDTALNVNNAPIYINIDVGNSLGIGTFIFTSYYAGYCFAGPADTIGYTASINTDTGEITVTAPNS